MDCRASLPFAVMSAANGLALVGIVRWKIEHGNCATPKLMVQEIMAFLVGCRKGLHKSVVNSGIYTTKLDCLAGFPNHHSMSQQIVCNAKSKSCGFPMGQRT